MALIAGAEGCLDRCGDCNKKRAELEWMQLPVEAANYGLSVADADVPPGSLVWITAFWFNKRKEPSTAATAQCVRAGQGIAKAAPRAERSSGSSHARLRRYHRHRLLRRARRRWVASPPDHTG